MKKLILLAAVLFVSATFTFAQFTFTSIDYPGGTGTTAHGINNHGVIVGGYDTQGQPRHALLIQKGKFIPLAPTTDLGTKYSEAYQINDRGDVVGITLDDNGFTHGFLLGKGRLTTLDFPGASETWTAGLNDSGTVAGFWNLYDPDGNFLYEGGFLWKDGVFTDVTFPGAGDTGVIGINARGDFVGTWDSGIYATTVSAFVFSKGQFTSFDAPFPGVWYTQANDINSTGKIVGKYHDGITQRGFLKVGDTFTRIDYPGALSTIAGGINSAGQMVGRWVDSSGAVHAWLAQPGNKGKP
jgi:uncharacterized membrane protein